MPLDLFKKTSIPEQLPCEMQGIIVELKKSSDKEDCLGRAYEILSKKYRGYRVKTYTKFFDIFSKDTAKIWQKNVFLHCTNINYIMRILLIKSGYFNEDEIKIKWAFVWCISPHQYLQVKINNHWINIDIWGNTFGIKFGDYAHGFH
ncbi:hypothetical protein KAJ61_00045 [Candidatus Parcubacteria bacterium]|nr:hypothetical protein [Candidatus Parcubacteria bacterium]